MRSWCVGTTSSPSETNSSWSFSPVERPVNTDLDLLVGLEAREAASGARGRRCARPGPSRGRRSRHRDPTRGLEHQLHGFGNGHEVARHLGMLRDGDGSAAGDLLPEDRHQAAVRAGRLPNRTATKWQQPFWTPCTTISTRLVTPMTLVGALPCRWRRIRTPWRWAIAACATLRVPSTLLRTASGGPLGHRDVLGRRGPRLAGTARNGVELVLAEDLTQDGSRRTSGWRAWVSFSSAKRPSSWRSKEDDALRCLGRDLMAALGADRAPPRPSRASHDQR